MNDVDKASLFLENAAKAAAGAYRIEGMEGLLARLLEIVPKGARVFCRQATDVEKIIAASFPERVTEYGSADVAIEEVAAAIAETGSIVCDSGNGRSVQASLLPPHHIAVVSTGRIFSTLEDLFGEYASSPPTNITVITGPSRTADIELNLVIGVHGPERLDVMVFA